MSLIRSSRNIAAGVELESSRRPARQVTAPPIRSRSPDAGAADDSADAAATNASGSCYCTCPPAQGFGVCLNVPAGTAPVVRGDCTTVPGWNDKATSPLWKATDVCPVSRLAAVGAVLLGAPGRPNAAASKMASEMTSCTVALGVGAYHSPQAWGQDIECNMTGALSHAPGTGPTGCGGYFDFNIIWDHLARICQLRATPTRAGCYALLSAHADRMLISAWNPML